MPIRLLPTARASLFALAVAPGGFIEDATTAQLRPRPTPQQVSALPQRGVFTFPAPYLTQGSRITNGSDCGGTDCVLPVGYSYWRNTNNHVGSNTMLLFFGLTTQRGGPGPSLFAYDKTTGAVTNRGPMFDATSPFRHATAEGWYFSGTRPTTLYMLDGTKLVRYDVEAKTFQTVLDVAARYGPNRFVWQPHSSDDDRVHSITLRETSSGARLGCAVYREDTGAHLFYPAAAGFDECHVDKSGRWLVILENVDGRYAQDNRIIDLDTGAETVILDEDGAGGHSDLGHGYLIGEDDWASEPGAARLWKFGEPTAKAGSQGLVAYHTTNWSADLGHVSHGNARPGVSPSQQYACSSNATRLDLPRSNEIVCFRMDGSLDVLVVAPVMMDLDAAGGGDDYSKHPMGNLDVTGEYFVFTTNLGGDRLDAFVVRVPSHKLVSPSSDTTPPAVAITAPASGSNVLAQVWVAAAASDASGIAGVQFKLDGVAIGAEDTSAPFEVPWDTATCTAGPHKLVAVARDSAGNTATSAPVGVSIAGSDTVRPVISGVAATEISSSGATIVWTTHEPATSLVLYGPTTLYASATPADLTPRTAHSRRLTGLLPGTTYHYRVRSRDAAGNVGSSSDLTFTTPAATLAGGTVVWTSLVNCDASGGTLRKVSGTAGVDDARGVSQQQLAGDGALEFTAQEIASIRFAGLSAAGGLGWEGIDFAIRLGPWSTTVGLAEVREKREWRTDISYVAGDRFRIEIRSGVVRYYKNGALFHTSAVTPSFPLRADASIFAVGARITSAAFVAAP